MNEAEKIIIKQMEFMHEASKTCGHTMVASITDFSEVIATLARAIPFVRQNKLDTEQTKCNVDQKFFEGLLGSALSAFTTPLTSNKTEEKNIPESSLELKRQINIAFLKMTLRLLEKTIAKDCSESHEMIKEARECIRFIHESSF